MSNKDNDFVEITTSDILKYVVKAYEIFNNTGVKPILYIEGPPGTGKTQMVKEAMEAIAEAMGLKPAPIGEDPEEGQFGRWITQAANTPEEALSGLPYPHHEEERVYTMVRAISGQWPGKGPGLWLFDEPLQAPYTQRFMAQVMYDGRIEDYVLPDGVLPVLCGNSSSDRAGVTKMWSHFQNRVITLRAMPTVEGALAHFMVPPTPELSVYLRWFPNKLFQFDGRSFDGPFPSGRSWDFANTAQAQGCDPIEDFPIFQGLLGTKEAQDYRACYTAVASLPNLDDMLKNPSKHKAWVQTTWNNNPHALCALSFVVLRRLDATREIDMAARAIQIFEYASMEIAASFLAVAKAIDERHGDDKTVLDTKEYADFVVRNQKLIVN